MKWEITGGLHHHCSVGMPHNVKDVSSKFGNSDTENIKTNLGTPYLFFHIKRLTMQPSLSIPQ